MGAERFQLIEIDAPTPYGRGQQYGAAAAEKIKAGAANYRRYFEEKMHMTWEQVTGYAMGYTADIRKIMPEILEEAQGIADGAGIPFEDLMVLNCRYELTLAPQSVPECTTAAVLPEATRDGRMFLIKNWDYRPGVLENIVLVHVRQPDGVRILGMTEAGQLIREGFNSQGIGLVNNQIKSIYDYRGTGIPATFRRRRVLASKTFDEAFDLLYHLPRSVSNNMLLASGAESRAVDLEASPRSVDLLKPIDGIVTHANHFVINPDLEGDKGREKRRDNRLHYLLMRRRGKIDLEYIQECMRDHEYYPFSICNHANDPKADPMSGLQTVASMIVDFREQEAHICRGNPCCGEYVTYRL